MKFDFRLKPFLILSICFVLFTVIGTVSHEYGHILVAKAYGHTTELHYGSMNYYPSGYFNDADYKGLVELHDKYKGKEKRDYTKDDLEEFQDRNQAIRHKYDREWKKGGLWIRLGGPTQTMLTGILGLATLFYRRLKIREKGLRTFDWLAVFLSLFWLRQVFNLLVSIGSEIISPNGTWFSGDEYYLSKDLGIWSGSISLATGIIGAVIARS